MLMCGIVGYVGFRNASPLLLDGLTRLEYRGYDSAGIAVVDAEGGLHHRKCTGRVSNLRERIASEPMTGETGIGHTRWATHGPATDDNAHPHSGGDGTVIVVHNGVVENYSVLK